MKLAVSGKGGVGKTTVAALVAHAFAAENARVIAIDADPDANLAYALGFPTGTVITPLTELKDLIAERVGAEPGQAAVYFRLNPRVDDIPERFSVQMGNLKLMAMGTIRRGGSGCACPEHVMIKQLLSHLLIEREDVVILDMEAGIEHLGRGTAQYVDVLLVVVQPTNASIQTYQRIKSLAADLQIPRVAVVANRIASQQDYERIVRETAEEPWCAIPESGSLSDYSGGAVDAPVQQEIARLHGRLKELVIKK